MTSGRPAGVDEWSLVINKQAEMNHQREIEEQALQKESKDLYKRDLQYQQYLRDLEQEKERKRREEEALDVQAKSRIFQQDAERRRLEEAAQKKNLADDYLRHKEYLKQKEVEERMQKLKEEQAHLDRVRAQMESEARRKKEFKSSEAQREQELLNFRRSEELAQKQADLSEKVYDLKLSQDYIAREEQKEQDYRSFYQRVSQDQLSKVNQHQQAVTSLQQERDSQVNQWIVDNQQQYQKRLADKEEMEKQIRLSAIQSTNQTVRAQLEEKERQRQAQQEEYRRQQDELSQKVTANRQWEEQKALERKQQQAQYRDVLAAQSSISQELRQASLRLSEHERMLNRNILGGRNTLQTSANQVLRNSAGFDQAATQFYGVTPNQGQQRSASQPRIQEIPGNLGKDAIGGYGVETAQTYEPVPPTTGKEYDRNAKAFFGDSRQSSAAPSKAGNPDPAWGKNAKAFYGAESNPPSAHGAAYQVPDVPTNADPGWNKAAKVFYGAESNPPSAHGAAYPGNIGSSPAVPDPTWSKNAKVFYGAESNPPSAHGVAYPRQGNSDPAPDPTWGKNAKAFYGAESNPPSAHGAVAAYQPQNPVSDPVPDPSYRQNARAFYGDSRGSSVAGNQGAGDLDPKSGYGYEGDAPAGAKRGDPYEAVDRSKHNPISNPIGNRPPVPVDRPLYRARRAMF